MYTLVHGQLVPVDPQSLLAAQAPAAAPSVIPANSSVVTRSVHATHMSITGPGQEPEEPLFSSANRGRLLPLAKGASTSILGKRNVQEGGDTAKRHQVNASAEEETQAAAKSSFSLSYADMFEGGVPPKPKLYLEEPRQPSRAPGSRPADAPATAAN
jgi:hypothetical protein